MPLAGQPGNQEQEIYIRVTKNPRIWPGFLPPCLLSLMWIHGCLAGAGETCPPGFIHYSFSLYQGEAGLPGLQGLPGPRGEKGNQVNDCEMLLSYTRGI